jgi:uncharacterized repeat protein (TIGR03943 family)
VAHTHEGDSSYYLDQLCTIFFCGALGAVCILMYRQDMLQYILTPFFYTPVVWGGAALLLLVAVRAVSLWQSAGKAGHVHDHGHDHGHDDHHHNHDHDHGHDHGHAHDHEHHHHNHDHAHGHDHGHSHGWTPAKYAVLLLPLVLYLLHLPNSSLAGIDAFQSAQGEARELEDTGQHQDAGSKGEISLGFKELSNAVYNPQQREYFEGHVGKLRGMYWPLAGEKEFTLFRVKMTCCAADAIPLEVRILSPENLTKLQPKQWVEVKGQIQFRKLAGKDKYVPVLQLKSADDVKPIPPQPSEYDT